MRESGEDYLETIFVLSKRNPEVHAVDIANELNFSKPSITRAMNILKKNGYIVIDENRHIKLTSSGKLKAEEIYERHKIITEFLVQNGISQKNAISDACHMEHDISDETFAFLKNSVIKNREKSTCKE